MNDYIIVDAVSKDELEQKTNKLISDLHFKLVGGVVVYKDDRNRLHFLQTLYKGV